MKYKTPIAEVVLLNQQDIVCNSTENAEKIIELPSVKI